MIAWLACVSAVSLLSATSPTPATVSPASAAAPTSDEPARARLVSEHLGLVPGTTAMIGVAFDIDDEWYLYWNGVNDSGFAPEIRLTLPDGYIEGKTLWPTPKRKISPGEILDHIYEKQLLLIIPIQVPESAVPGERIRFDAEMDWLVCREACIPGSAEVALSLPVVQPDAQPARSPSAPLFDAARKRHPKPLPEIDRPVQVRLRPDRESYTIEAITASRIAFYPAEGSARLTDLIKDGIADGKELTIRLARPEQSIRLVGIVEVWTDRTTSTAWWIDTSPGATSGVSGSTPPSVAEQRR